MIALWSSLHAAFISQFFMELNMHGIRYFVLRNYEGLPETNSGKDVDVVIAPGTYHKVTGILKGIIQNFNIYYFQVSKFETMRCWYIMDDAQYFAIHIDIIENEVYKGFQYFDFEYLYANVIPYKDFYVLNKTMDTVLLLAQNIIAYKRLKDKYRRTITQNYLQSNENIDNEIRKLFELSTGNKVVEALRKNDYACIENKAKDLQQAFIRRTYKTHPLQTLCGNVRFLADRFYRVIWCPNKLRRFIAVEAPDGTGKTTFINALIERLQKYYVCDEGRFCVHHFRPNILPNLGELGEKAKLMKQDTNFTVPHRKKPAGFMSSFIRMLYYWLDYLLGVPILLRKEVHYERYSIYDRYIYDFLIDPARSRISLPRWLRMLFVKTVVQPQIVFVLQASADVIYSRKQELDREEIERQLTEFGRLKNMASVVFINAERPIDEMVDEAVKCIMERFCLKIDN